MDLWTRFNERRVGASHKRLGKRSRGCRDAEHRGWYVTCSILTVSLVVGCALLPTTAGRTTQSGENMLARVLRLTFRPAERMLLHKEDDV